VCLWHGRRWYAVQLNFRNTCIKKGHFHCFLHVYKRNLKTIHGSYAAHLYWDRLATPAITVHQGQRGARNQKYRIKERFWLRTKLPSYSSVNLNWTVEFPTRETNARSGCLWLAVNTLKHQLELYLNICFVPQEDHKGKAVPLHNIWRFVSFLRKIIKVKQSLYIIFEDLFRSSGRS